MQRLRPSPQTSRRVKSAAVIRSAAQASPQAPPSSPRSGTSWLYPSLVLAAFVIGLLVSYRMWAGDTAPSSVASVDNPPSAPASDSVGTSTAALDLQRLRDQVNPPQGYRIGVAYGDLGPRLLAAGVIDYDAFTALYDRAGAPLDATQTDALLRGSDEQVVISQENSHFLLNFFWAVGLASRNPILTQGSMVKYGSGKITGFASTGGWSIAAKPVEQIYASLDLIPLTSEQQARVEAVASAVYRPCCNNPTSFPDCNHGMAMLGLLELMASHDATLEGMFTAAKYVNAYWFPRQALETALYLDAKQGIDFAEADPRMLTGAGLASSSGFAAIHEELQLGGLLPPETRGSGSCAT